LAFLRHALSLLLLGSTISSPAATIQVTNSIAQAVEQARSGDTLIIQGPHVFHEHVVLRKALRLLGTNSPVLDGDGAGTPLTLLADSAEVRGLLVQGGGTDLANFDSGIMLMAPRTTVADCQVEGGGFGLYIRGVDECHLERNRILGNTNVPASQRGNGIHLWKTKGNVVVGNFVTGARDGAYFSYADNNLIASNRIERTRFGIHYMYSNNNRLVGNMLSFNAVGAALMFARNCQVEDNSAFANRRHGILLKQVEHSRFVRNRVSGQNRGFFIQQAAQNRFEENTIADNDIGLYLSNGSEQNTFVGNAFQHNSDQIWQPQDEMELGRLASNHFYERGRGNFWSDYTGADRDGNGIGDTPYHETDLYGYLVDHHPAARVFALSPAVALLRAGEELLPVLNTEGVTDPFPLMRPPTAPPGESASVSPKPSTPKAAP
jgi:nitrous oxidase accessory protein